MHLGVTRGETRLRFEVHDSGIGIAPEQVGRLFQDFHQVGDVAAKSGGSGLGLALSKHLVGAHGR